MKNFLGAITIASMVGGCVKPDLTPGDAVLVTADGVTRIISCPDNNRHEVCQYTGTDEGFFLEPETTSSDRGTGLNNSTVPGFSDKCILDSITGKMSCEKTILDQ